MAVALAVVMVAFQSGAAVARRDTLRPSGGDDVPQLQAALDRGGTIRLRGTFRLVSTFQSNGGPAHLRIGRSGTTITGGTLVSDVDAAMFAVGPEPQYHDAPVTPLSGPLAKGTRTLTAPGFRAGDYIYIRMGQTLPGQTNQPDAEVNRVASVSGDRVTLAWPTVKAYRAVAGYPYGVANVTDRTIRDVTIRGVTFDHRGFAHALIGGQVVGFKLIDNTGTFRGGFQSMGSYRFGEARGNVLHHVGAGPVTYTLTTATGTSDVTWTGNTITGERVIQLHVHEGSARVTIDNNDIRTGDSLTDENQISVRAYAYDIAITNNRLDGSPGSCAIYAGESTDNGGRITDNTVLSSGGAAICVDAPGWEVARNVTPNAPNSLPYNP